MDSCSRADHFLPAEEVELQKQYIEKIKAQNAAKAAVPGVFVLTFGCQQNEADSEKLAGMAEAMGYKTVSNPQEAELIVVNTCAIREHAEQKALSIVGQYKHLKAQNPDLTVAVCGCMVTQAHRREEIKRSLPYVDIVFGTSSIHRFPQLLWERREKDKRMFLPDEEKYMVAEGLPIRRGDNRHAWVSIMYGCNNFCSYCIVPYVRGRERSRRAEDIVREVRELVQNGYRDITLLGQNVNSYGKDNDDGIDFADLLAMLDAIEGDWWLRFMTSHPKDATRKLVDVMANGRHIAHHFHLPIQSGSDRILKLMNRHYDLARYQDILSYIRQTVPDMAVTTDIIVGFPGETEEDFEATLNVLKSARFDMIFSFIYSPRRGTPAAEMPDQIPPAVQSERFNRLLQTQNAISLEVNAPLNDTTVRVLCDGPSKNDPGVWSGRTATNKIVFFDAGPADIGQFLNVHVTRADTFALYGDVIR